MATKKLTVEKWQEQNPLRLWLDNPWARGKLAALVKRLGVTRQSVFNWMWGKTSPSYAMLTKIQAATGITSEAWAEWLRARPKESEKCGASA